MKTHVRTRLKWAIVGSMAAFAVAATGSLATGHLAGGDLNACATNGNGQLRLVAEASECRPSETAVSWSATGGTTTFETVTATAPLQSPLTTATATCPPGSRVVGGGGHANPVDKGNVIADYPVGDDAWTVTAAATFLAQSVTAYAVCAG